MNHRIDPAILSASLETPERDVQRPGRAQPTSAITQIASLKVGESWSAVEKPPENTPLKDFAADSSAWRDALRNRIQSSVRHAKARTGGSYVMETGDFISSARNVYLICVVTRAE